MLVYVRSLNETLLRARVPEAQDQRGRPSSLLHYPFQLLSPISSRVGWSIL